MNNQQKQNLVMQHKFVVREAYFVNKEKNGSNFKIQPHFSKKIIKISDNKYDVSIKVEIKDLPTDPFPFELSAVISLITIFNDASLLTKDELDAYLNVTCIQMLFPYLRTTVTSLTNVGMVNPIVLPIVDVRQFSK